MRGRNIWTKCRPRYWSLAAPRFTDATPRGKLIVVMEGATQGVIGAKTKSISGLPNVLSAVMVFQATDSNDAAV